MPLLFKKPRLQKKFPLIISLASTLLFIGVYQSLVFNITPSMPEGIYLKTHSSIKRGSIVLVCLDKEQAKFGLTRHYLIEGNRNCNNTVPLIKEVIAVPHDNVLLTDNSISVNGKKYQYPTFYQDSAHRPLPVYPRGEYPNTTGNWLLGVTDPRSWDSRYWGPLPQRTLRQTLLPLITW